MTNVPTITGARLIAETLHGYEDLGIRRIVTHSEKAAAYMADGFARVSGRPGVCMAQSVGAANLAAGLQDAYLGCSPVIALTGRKPPAFQHRNAYQEIAHGPLFDPVTKYNVNVSTMEQLVHYLCQAFREATCGTPRPVHLDVMGHRGDDIELSTGNLHVIIEDTFARYPSQRPEPGDEDVQRAVQAMEKASQPVIVAGGGASASSAGPAIVELAEMLSIPVATSVNGKGIISDDHPLSVGVVGTYSRRCANQTVSEADLVIYVGSHTGDQVTNEWTIPKPGTRIIQIDIDPSELGRNYPHTIGLAGDAQATVRKLIANGELRMANCELRAMADFRVERPRAGRR